MPVTPEGRRVQTSPGELNRWLGRESAGEPVQIATENTDLSAELKRGLSYVRKHGRAQSKNETPRDESGANPAARGASAEDSFGVAAGAFGQSH
jgi:hypothetical protein